MSDFRADLHCHTTFSDGSDTPAEILELAVEKELSGLSVTDHDTVRAYPEIFELAQTRNIRMIPGVEFSAVHHGIPIHVLGYAFVYDHPALQSLCEHHAKRRTQRNRKILEKLQGLGFRIEEEELRHYEGQGAIGRPHIAQALMEKGVVSSVREAFDRFLGEGKPAYDPGEPISVEETLEVIHAAKGLAVLAHPHLVRKGSVVRHVLKLPFDGIEGYYARMPLAREKEWIAIGKERGWIITGGSDYHGATKPESILGSSWVGEETFNRLYEHYEQIS